MKNIALSKDAERFIRKQIESGRFENADEVIDAGLQMLASNEQPLEEWLRNEIPGRYGELIEGRAEGVSIDDAFSRLEDRHRARLAAEAKSADEGR
ncbi:type II toxin-antitoxin system ParD family antitoxin [Rhizobiales bacterium]|uniref:type II toxin-antitoxin system ParD family antitoxin n=1 Tax=unclassified Neorhizobium TaxID=2629175 RepID=UPI000DDF1874